MSRENLSAFCQKRRIYAEKLSRFLEAQKVEEGDEEVIEILRDFLLTPECTEDVMTCFPRLLPAVVSAAIPTDSEVDSDAVHRLNCVVLGKLVTANRDTSEFALRYFDSNPAPFQAAKKSKTLPRKRRKYRRPKNVTKVSDAEVLKASYEILRHSQAHFKQLWPWSKVYKYLASNDDAVRWQALKCLAIVLGMSEATRRSCASIFLSDAKKFFLEHEEAVREPVVSSGSPEGDTVSENLESVVSVGGILLPVFEESSGGREAKLVPVASAQRNLMSLALAVTSGKCVCLQGAVGSGKTALVEHLAWKTGHDSSNFVKVQLGDQTDSKMLLGMYKCTDTPRAFAWQPGVLTEAVTHGKWLLLEDIDCASTDVASVLGHLVESGSLCVPGYRDSIRANSGFRLFLTRRLASGGTQRFLQLSGAASLMHKYCAYVNVEPLTRAELVEVVRSLFPRLSTVATKMVDVFLLFSVGHQEEGEEEGPRVRIGRQTSTRDLMKWCARAVVDFDVASPDSALKILQDAMDLFCCSVADRAQRLALSIAVSNKLGIVQTKAEYFSTVHKPTLTLRPDSFLIGRARLPRVSSPSVTARARRTTFSYTRPSACLLERIASCVAQKEPVLLVGETGTGKTSTVQRLADSTGHRLVVINMNQQSESADLLGGYKPTDMRFLVAPVREDFEVLFRSFYADAPNERFLSYLGQCADKGCWVTVTDLLVRTAERTARKLSEAEDAERLDRWRSLLRRAQALRTKARRAQSSLPFSFVEGSLVRALRNGDWVLLDEINLATAETLECLSGLLESSSGTLSLLERGDKEPLERHPDFALFACMNPATDVGKKELPTGLRNRFTEFFVDELTEKADLRMLADSYLGELNLPVEKLERMVRFYLDVRREAEVSLTDGTGHKPHFSLRTLCRALSVSAQNPCGSVQRSVYEGFSLSFLTQLDRASYERVRRMIGKAVLDEETAKAVLKNPMPLKGVEGGYACMEEFLAHLGSRECEAQENYIITESVKRNLIDLLRAITIGKMPVLLQGDTSVGKTSLITFVARATGQRCVRINNHEHTDLHEYLGSYGLNKQGRMVFKHGVLVEAMRQGHWIILDELNLAPSDVLEALNRVLDDNREIFIPETQEVVKAHEKFMLFATQNPAGLYGGRKVLSRAFRNRFVELHYDEIPADELAVILHKRCKLPESYCKQMISVMQELQLRRKSTATFAGKQGFITLRDLFRWGERYRLAPAPPDGFYDWSQHLADEGYLVLSSKVRRSEESKEILEVLRKHMKRDVDPEALFTLSERTSPVTRPILASLTSAGVAGFEHLVWTFQTRRLAVLLRKCCQFKEPVLLVGETGGGKTTVCQLLASAEGKSLSVVNCHMHTESADFLGCLRPVRDRERKKGLFEWVDGPLVKAMRSGGFFLADEISLADDGVLERLNSLLEPDRQLLLAETSDPETCVVTAHEEFVFVGTMNPGGDYGKKELSPALRNRFTEVWCDSNFSPEDLRRIMSHNLRAGPKESVSQAMLNFFEWLRQTEVGRKLVVSVRDVLTWVNFVNRCGELEIGDAFYHGACLSYVDGLGSGLTGSENPTKLKDFKKAALSFIEKEAETTLNSKLTSGVHENSSLDCSKDKFGIHPFYIDRGVQAVPEDVSFSFSSPTTRSNTLKLLRGLQLNKPILLEGSPGVGKTSLVCAVARASGHPILRLNLSDQTDISDLFGADLPTEGGERGQFSWRDGPFLRALKSGHWILLDELNLASQSVLEGLNACFDHRGEVYVPELDKTFHVSRETRLFGCQNPLRQGGGRRGLPKSFLNRFTQVFVDALEDSDLKFILRNQFPELPEELLDGMILFNQRLSSEAGVNWGHSGAPWEMNLRDVTRWCQVTVSASKRTSSESYDPGSGAELIYVNRMRTEEDREKVRQIYAEIFPLAEYPLPITGYPVHLTTQKLHAGEETLLRSSGCAVDAESSFLLLRSQKPSLRCLVRCVNMNWMSILVGGPGCGKSSLVRLLADLAGQKLKTVVVNSAMDTTEILGGFEQTDCSRHFDELLEQTEAILMEILRNKLTEEYDSEIKRLHVLLERIRQQSEGEKIEEETTLKDLEPFFKKVEALSKLVAALKARETSYQSKLTRIEERLTELLATVRKDSCLNAGGRFEWVDSVLVKCLENGTWLLLDQVNLCSPAVLDRLNGLLEPNGVLTIGEKGVDSQGNVHIVKPHENFRLFLTMDPRYGEISRAMRNRGVEISMLTPKDLSSYDPLDLKSLLHHHGIPQIPQQNRLKRLHCALSDRLGFIELLQTSSFVSRQLSKGFDFDTSLRNACREVYGVCGSRSRKELSRRIDELLEEQVEGESGRFRLDVESVTLRSSDLLENSRLACVRQQGFLLKAALEILRDPETATKFDEDFLDFYNTESVRKNVELVLRLLLVDFYERSSLDDLSIRRGWLQRLFSSRNLRNFESVNETLAKEVERFGGQSTVDKELPLRHVETKFFDKMSTLLYLRSVIVEDTTVETTKRQKIMTLEEYSRAVCFGQLSDHLEDRPIISNFVKLVDQSRRTIEFLLLDDSFEISPSLSVRLREQLRWLRRLSRLGRTRLHDSLKNKFLDLASLTSVLKIHCRWVEKSTRDLFASAGPHVRPETRNELSRFLEVFSTLSSHPEWRNRWILKFLKRVRKFLVLPPPHATETSMDNEQKLRDACRKLEVNDSDLLDPSRTRSKLVFLSSDESLSVRQKFIHSFSAMFSKENGDLEVPLDLDQLEEASRKSKEASDKEFSRNPREVQIWPVHEFFFHVFCFHFARRVAQSLSRPLMDEIHGVSRRIGEKTDDLGEDRESRGNLGEICDERLIEVFERLPTLPAETLGLLKVLNGKEVSVRRRALLLQELLVCLEKFVDRSFVGRNWELLSRRREVWKEGVDTGTSDEPPRITMSSYVDLILNLTSRRSPSASTVSLSTHQQQKHELRLLHSLLFHNSAALNSPDFHLPSNDLQLLSFSADLFTTAVVQATVQMTNRISTFLTDDQKDLLEKEFFSSARMLRTVKEELEAREHHNDPKNQKNDEDGLLVASGWLILGYAQLFLFSQLVSVDPVRKGSIKLSYLKEDLQEAEVSLELEKIQSNLLGVSVETNLRQLRVKRAEELRTAVEKIGGSVASRPSVGYEEVRANMAALYRHVGSFKRVRRQMDRCFEFHRRCRAGLPADRAILDELRTLKRSVERFSGKLELNHRSCFPDVVFPPIFAISSVRRGISMFLEELERARKEESSRISRKGVVEVLRFPVIGGQDRLVKSCFSGDFGEKGGRWRFEMTKVGLRELENLVSSSGRLEEDLWEELNGILKEIVEVWKEQERRKEEKQKEEESLFKTKQDTEEDEEEDFKTVFPMFQDFQDEEPSLETHHTPPEVEPSPSTPEKSLDEVITAQDSREILEIHWNLLSGSKFPANFVDPLIERFELLRSGNVAWPKDACGKLSVALNVLVARRSRFQRGSGTSYDFYRDGNLEEVESCQEICERLSTRIEEFLDQWPENPLLLSIRSILERILDFPVDSSISRFLTGLELLSTKIHQWEENARSDVSLLEYLDLVGRKILDWRRIEITRWRDSLRILEEELKTEASRWWFHLYDLVDQFLRGGGEFGSRGAENSLEKGQVVEGKSTEGAEESTRTSFLMDLRGGKESGSRNSLEKVEISEEKSMEDVEKSTRTLLSMESRRETETRSRNLESGGNSLEKVEIPGEKSMEDVEKSTRTSFSMELRRETETRSRNLESGGNSLEKVEIPEEKSMEDVEKSTRTSSSMELRGEKEAKENLENARGSAEDVEITTEKLLESLDRFMNESSLVEFQSRLDLLLLFYRHTSRLENSPRKKDLCSILWNVYHYYRQFSSDVETKLSNMKKPIEKKLKDTIEISRWTDSSYWAVRSTTEKTRRALHKFVREFRKCLRENASSTLVVKPGPPASQKLPRRSLLPNPLSFAVSTVSCAVPEVEKYLTKSKQFCTRVVARSPYPGLREDVESFVEDVLDECKELRDFEIDRNLPKNKQISQAKSILHRKKTSLANYFKSLTKIGLSYRVGLLRWRNRRHEVFDFTATPLDLREIEEFGCLRDSGASRGIVEQWNDCDGYYYGCLARLQALDAILKSSRSDLGPQNVERCRGFSMHLILLAHEQKTELADFFRDFLPLAIQISNLREVPEVSRTIDEEAPQKPLEIPVLKFQESLRKFKELLVTLEVGFLQLNVFLESRPADSVEEHAFDLQKSRIPPENSLGNETLDELAVLSRESLDSLRKVTDSVDPLLSASRKLLESGGIFFFHAGHSRILRDCVERIRGIGSGLLEVKRKFPVDHPIGENLEFLAGEVERSGELFEFCEELVERDVEGVERFRRDLDALVTSVLVVVQERYKETLAKRVEKSKEKSKERSKDSDGKEREMEMEMEMEMEEEEEEEEEELEENLFKEKLVGNLKRETRELRVRRVSKGLEEILKRICGMDWDSMNRCTEILLQRLPLLHQYLLFVSHYLHEHVSTFRLTCKFLHLQLSVFLELASSGFCVPKDLDLDAQTDDQGESSEQSGGLGLADGEGTKDVSDRLESEDQLDEAKKPNEETEPSDKETKEEESGVEVSENFEGRLEDLGEQAEGQEDQKEDEDEDAEKEMGETEENCDRLDEKMWGDDEEEPQEEEEEGKEEKEERGSGKEESRTEYGAKEGESKEEEEESSGRREEEETRKEIDELEEPEVDEEQTDPYHGRNQPEVETEPLDLPEDLNLDDGAEEKETEEENPFDVDEMKESKTAEEKEEETTEGLEEEAKKDEETKEDSSDEEMEEEGKEDGGGKKKEKEEEQKEGVEEEKKEEQEEEMEENKGEDKEDEKVEPSVDEGTMEVDGAEETDTRKDGSRDRVENSKDLENEQLESTQRDTSEHKDGGSGQSEAQEQEGQSGASNDDRSQSSGAKMAEKPLERRRKPGKSDDKRSLLDDREPEAKKLKVDENPGKTEEQNEKEVGGETERFEHTEDSAKFDELAVDAATEEQLKKQTLNLDQKDVEEAEELEDTDVEMHEDQPREERTEDPEKVEPERTEVPRKDRSSKSSKEKSEPGENLPTVEVEGQTSETSKVPRGNETTYHTRLPETESSDFSDIFGESRERERRRFEVEARLSLWKDGPSSEEASTVWNTLSSLTEAPARELAEKLRLVLEPTQKTRLRGDYRTGRRINMRKIIPYIASDFRKDKIWLRRTKPARRDYQIVLAVDDSSSMADNHSKELAFESLSLIGKALTYLEAGELCVINFGENVNILHPLGENFNDERGARLIQEMKFEQKKTMIGQLVDFTVDMFESHSSSFENAKLLVILSDGRGIFSEGMDKVNSAVRRAKLANIFLVFIIVDNPVNRDSILDIRMPVFEGGKLLGIRSYMDIFPFPFYIILKDLNTLPGVLSDALRQWFEIVGRIDS